MNIGQPEAPALVLETQSLVLDAHQLQDCGDEIMNVHSVSDDVVAELIGLSVSDSRLDASARHPSRKASRVVIPSIVIVC